MKVWIIEDESVVARTISQLLELRYDAEIEISSSVAECKKMIEQGPFDALLVDYNLPDGTGYKFIADSLKDHPWLVDALHIFVSGVSYVDLTPDFQESTRVLKNCHVRNKPVNASALYEILDTVLPQKG